MLDIKKPELFISEAKGEEMSLEKLSVSKSMPTQVPEGVDAEELEKDNEKQQKVIIGVVVLQIIAALTLKGAKQDLLSLILSLQVIVALKNYDVSIPANFDQFSDKIQEVIDGKAISPQFLVRLFKPDFTYAGAMGLPKDALDGTILESWGFIFVAVISLILACLFAAIAYCICKEKREIIEEKVKTKKK